MVQSFKGLLSRADFTRESDLYATLKEQLLSRRTAGFPKDRRIPEDALEGLAAAGTAEPVPPKPDAQKQ